MLTDSLLQDLICNLQDIDLLRRDERGEWLLSRDLDQVSRPIFTNAPSCASRWPSSTCRIVMTAGTCRIGGAGRSATALA